MFLCKCVCVCVSLCVGVVGVQSEPHMQNTLFKTCKTPKNARTSSLKLIENIVLFSFD